MDDPNLKYAYLRYRQQRNRAKQRGVPFLLTFDEWWSWWNTENRWRWRGRGRGRYVMARNKDIGPYSLDNIYCATGIGNRRDVDATKFKPRNLPTEYPHLTDRTKHPKARAVLTPEGRFPSAALAAERYGIGSAAATRRARLNLFGWRYENAS